MSTIGATLGYGSTVEIGDAASGSSTWTAIVGVQDFDYDLGERERVDVTHHASPDTTRETILGLKDSRQIRVPILDVPGSATDTLLKSLHGSGAKREIRFGDGGSPPETVTFVGAVQNLSFSRPVEGAKTCTVTFLVDAAV